MSKARLQNSKNYVNKESGRRYQLKKISGFQFLVTVDDMLPSKFPADDYTSYPEEWLAIDASEPLILTGEGSSAVKDEEIATLKERVLSLKKELKDAKAGKSVRGKYNSKKDRLVKFLRGDFSVLFDKDDNEVREGDFVLLNGKSRCEVIVKDEELHLKSDRSGRAKPARACQLSKMTIDS
jgi:hypothetical protein